MAPNTTEKSQPQAEQMEFKAEVQQLLNILSQSLYKEREIFLRELISNASDALHRMQFEMLTNENVLDPETELAIHLDFDEEANTLTVSDTGVGMTHDELVEDLGTIAHSGAMAFMDSLEEGQQVDEIIGQFGVGFYAVFIVADEVRVTTRSYRPDAEAWTWISHGDSRYEIRPADKATRGTEVEIHLKENAQGFASAWRLRQIVEKHSNYVSFPTYVEDEAANQRTAIWRQGASSVDDEAYDEFYQQLTRDTEEPLLHIHVVADVPIEVRSILYVPRSRERGILQARTDYGLRLYSRKVLIQEHNKDMLPEYFRFVEGVVDSADIPLNVARETVQSNRTLNHIKTALRGRLIRALKDLGEDDPETYAIFWENWGPFIKEGVATDFAGREDLLPLLRFPTTQSKEKAIALSEYVERMAEDQEAIYYILGDTLDSVETSPHLDYFRSQDLEVLYMVDPLDAFMTQSLREFEDIPLKNVDDPDLELPEREEPEKDEGEESLSPERFGKVIVRFQKVLGDRVTEVRASKVLRGSPCRLVSAEGGPQREMQRVQRYLDEHYEIPAQVLEINRGHPLIQNLGQMIERSAGNPLIDMSIEQLYENMLLLEGLHPNPAQMVPRIQSLLEQAASTASDPGAEQEA
jgi:molecular chaperone HtpG